MFLFEKRAPASWKGQKPRMATYHLSAKVGSKGMGRAHSDYIDRVGKNAKKKDLEHAENGNLPDWANGKASVFWSAADDQERENGSVYRELEIALPRELTQAQRLELVREFIGQEIGEKHTYSFAIHCPIAALDKAKGEQPHAHIMYSERLLDGIKRPQEQYFKRYNSKNPEKGGLKKAIPKDMVEKKEQLKDLRERWAELQNKHLEKHGHTDRVTEKSLEAQGIKHDPAKHLPHLGVAAIAILQKGQPSTRIKMLGERVKALREEHDKAPSPVVEVKAKKQPQMVSRYDPQHPNYTEFMAQREQKINQEKENERRTAASLERIGANIRAASQLASDPNRHPQGVAKATSQYKHTREAGGIAQAAGKAIGGIIKKITRATSNIETSLEAIKKIETVKSVTLPQKSLTERIAESLEAFILWVKGKDNGKLKEINLERSDNIGRIEQLSDYHAVQHLGLGHYAIHELDKLDLKPQLQDMATIKYHDGRGAVQIETERSKKDKGIAD